ncbi:Peptidase M20 domain-containing protein [Colletotrichum sidae]|uniref:Peptidase M20 domain-containing protein n=1 Tax=Colletotrichum sidae TaxID=1347389 RepID=A0A4R8TQ43_9PEZI|nr:Peptidase M20 domain-containing protein [Colletotrichum sidae]
MATNIMDHPVVDLLKSLMSIVSTSELEHGIGVFLEHHLQSLGYTVERIPIAPGSPRHNVYAYLGSARQTRVLLTAHMDTVPPHIPPATDGDVVRGRGSSDDLGPLAAQIVAAEELRKEGQVSSEGDVALLFVVGEENGGHGMVAANDMGVAWESGIFAEPTESKLAKGHKGQVAFELVATGFAWQNDSHSGYPHLGKSATSALLAVLNDLSAATWPESDLLGPSTFNIGTLEGGEKHNIVAPSAKALCEVRMVADLPGIKTKIAEIVSKHPDIELRWVFEYPEALLDWQIEGFDAAPVAFGTDVPRLRDEFCKNRVLYGPGSILVAHGPDEYIRVPELIDSIDGYKRLVLHFLG